MEGELCLSSTFDCSFFFRSILSLPYFLVRLQRTQTTVRYYRFQSTLLCFSVHTDLFNFLRWINRCQGWLWTAQVARWPSANLRQLWVDGPPLDRARLWAHSYGNEPSSGLMDRQSQSRGCRKCKDISCASLRLAMNWCPFPSRTSLQNMKIVSPFFPSPFLCLSFSLLCEWIGSHTGLQPGSFCLSYGFWS